MSAYGVHAFLEVNYKILQFSVTCGGGYDTRSPNDTPDLQTYKYMRPFILSMF